MTRINDEKDVCFTVDGRLRLYTDNTSPGLVDIDSFVTASDDASLLEWFDGNIFPRELTNRNATGFPIIAGYASLEGGSEAFILIPVQ